MLTATSESMMPASYAHCIATAKLGWVCMAMLRQPAVHPERRSADARLHEMMLSTLISLCANPCDKQAWRGFDTAYSDCMSRSLYATSVRAVRYASIALRNGSSLWIAGELFSCHLESWRTLQLTFGMCEVIMLSYRLHLLLLGWSTCEDAMRSSTIAIDR